MSAAPWLFTKSSPFDLQSGFVQSKSGSDSSDLRGSTFLSQSDEKDERKLETVIAAKRADVNNQNRPRRFP